MKIALDAMGGDLGPAEVVAGGVAAAQELGVEIAFVGLPEQLEGLLAEPSAQGLSVSLVPAEEVIEMADPPAIAVRHKPRSSIVVAVKLVKSGEASAMVSAGNSGAVMAASLLHLGTLSGVERPALAASFPSVGGPTLLMDAGANSDCRPSLLVEFAHMGYYFMQRVQGVPEPRVGLLSIGQEDSKGNELVRETHGLLKVSDLNFIGNVEGHDLLRGRCDVIVCDGFTGNVVMKTVEGTATALMSLLREEVNRSAWRRAAGLALRPALRAVVRRMDYTEYGGVPLLGVNGVVVIAHGRSPAKAIRNAIAVAQRAVAQDLLGAMRTGILAR